MTELSEDLNNTPIAVILRGAEVESDEHGEGGVLRTQGTIHPGGFIVFFTDGSGSNLELSQVQGQDGSIDMNLVTDAIGGSVTPEIYAYVNMHSMLHVREVRDENPFEWSIGIEEDQARRQIDFSINDNVQYGIIFEPSKEAAQKRIDELRTED
jgi:hypothetical protein